MFIKALDKVKCVVTISRCTTCERCNLSKIPFYAIRIFKNMQKILSSSTCIKYGEHSTYTHMKDSIDGQVFKTRILTPDKTVVIDLSQVADQPIYVIPTLAKLIIANKLNIFLFHAKNFKLKHHRH